MSNLVIRQLYAERLRELLLTEVDDREDRQDCVEEGIGENLDKQSRFLILSVFPDFRVYKKAS